MTNNWLLCLSAAILIAPTVASSDHLVFVRHGARSDLDAMSDQQLRQYLVGELDDIYSNGPPNVRVGPCTLYKESLEALSDDGDDDDDDSLDDAIDEDELNDEMEEAGTDLEDVVDEVMAAHCHRSGDAVGGPRVPEGEQWDSQPPPQTRTQAVNGVAAAVIRKIRQAR